jgi:hypothetical protein
MELSLMLKKSIVITSLLVSSSVYSNGYEVHILKKGDTLSELLEKKGYTPLYGEGNWVEKTLKLNHLNIAQDVEIKKTLPIILPKRSKTIIDKVTMKKSSILRKGLLGNEISRHQDVRVKFDYSQKSIKLPSKTINQNQDFGIGLDVIGKNNYTVSSLNYNFYAGLMITSHGSAKLKTQTAMANRFEPTYQGHAGIIIKSPKLNFKFGPLAQIEQKTRIEEKETLLNMRRDQVTSLGFKIEKDFYIDHLEYRTNVSYSKGLIHDDIESNGEFQTSQLSFNASVNLTSDYHLGLNAKATQYSNIGINRESSMGLNLTYDLN